jgi:hypothetical protein
MTALNFAQRYETHVLLEEPPEDLLQAPPAQIGRSVK